MGLCLNAPTGAAFGKVTGAKVGVASRLVKSRSQVKINHRRH